MCLGQPQATTSEAHHGWRWEWFGVRGFFEHLERKKYKLHVRVFLSRYRGYSLCGACGGARLRNEARQVKIAGLNIASMQQNGRGIRSLLQ